MFAFELTRHSDSEPKRKQALAALTKSCMYGKDDEACIYGKRLEEKLQRMLAGRPAGVDRLAHNPAVPFLQEQISCFLLLHDRAFPATGARGGWMDRAGQAVLATKALAPPHPMPPSRENVADSC